MSESTEGTHPTTGPEPTGTEPTEPDAAPAAPTEPDAPASEESQQPPPAAASPAPPTTAPAAAITDAPPPEPAAPSPPVETLQAHQPVPPPAATPEPGPVPTPASTQPPPAPAATDAPPPEPAAPSPPVETPQAHQPVPPPPATPEPGPVPTPASTQPPQPASTPDPSAAAPPSDPTAPPVPPPPARPAVPSPTALAARPGPPRPTPAAPGGPAAGGTAPAAASRAHASPGASAAEAYGRIDAEGMVHVRLADGTEQVVGQWAAGEPAEGLAFFARKYDDLAVEVDLATRRLRDGKVPADQAAAVVKKAREALAEPAMVGDLAALDAHVATLEALVGARREAAAAEKAAAKAKILAARETIAQEAESLAESTQWKSTGERFKTLLETWKTTPRADRAAEQELWKRFSHARSVFDKRRRQYFAKLDGERGEAKQVKESIVAEAEALATSTDWGATAGAYRDLMARWKAAGRAGKSDEERLWDRFRQSQDAFFAARNATFETARRRAEGEPAGQARAADRGRGDRHLEPRRRRRQRCARCRSAGRPSGTSRGPTRSASSRGCGASRTASARATRSSGGAATRRPAPVPRAPSRSSTCRCSGWRRSSAAPTRAVTRARPRSRGGVSSRRARCSPPPSERPPSSAAEARHVADGLRCGTRRRRPRRYARRRARHPGALGSAISKVKRENAIRSRVVLTDADRMFTWVSESARVTSDSSRDRSRASTCTLTRNMLEALGAQLTGTSRSGSWCSRARRFTQSCRCTETPLPRVTKPLIASPGTGVQHFASLTQTSSSPSTTMPGSPCGRRPRTVRARAGATVSARSSVAPSEPPWDCSSRCTTVVADSRPSPTAR